jgi:DNA/RNA-binding domain of Phe-tRNA-synthetase-like protein
VSDRFHTTPRWSAAYPGALAGVLVMRGAADPAGQAGLDARKADLERHLRERYAGMDRATLLQDPLLQAYAAYYKGFKKTYHVQLQLESVVFKGKSLPPAPALVTAMFMAELEHKLLTAGHDLDCLALPATLDVAQGGERYVTLRGEPASLKAGDMFIADGQGIISDILYGPDQRTRITPATRAVMVTIYAPPGVPRPAVAGQLAAIAENVRAAAPGAVIESSEIYPEEHRPQTADG